VKKSDLKYLNAESDRMIVSAINSHYPNEPKLYQFKIYHHELKEGLKRDRLRDESLQMAIQHFESVGFVVVDHPQFGMLRLTLDLNKAVFSPAQATLFNERNKKREER
jgi:hypothetical protein